MTGSQQHYPVKLTQAQRKVVAAIVPELANRGTDRRDEAAGSAPSGWKRPFHKWIESRKAISRASGLSTAGPRVPFREIGS